MLPVLWVEFPTLPVVQTHLIISCVAASLAILVLCARVTARYMKGAKLWWDDYLALAAMPQGIIMVVIQGLYTKLGVGYPMTEVMVNLPLILRLLVVYEIVYSCCVSTVKMSMLAFYLRVFVNKGLRRATVAAMVFTMTWSIANIIQVFLICRPFARSYDPSVPGTCGDQIASFIAIGSFNVVTDCIILSLPLTTIWNLKMKTPAKLGLTGVFLVGLSVSAVAIVRIISITQLVLLNLTGTMINADFWSAFEPNLAIICVSLPMIGPLLACCGERLKSTQEESSGHTGGSSSGFSKGSKKFNRLHDNNTQDYGMDDLYTQNKDNAYGVSVTEADNGRDNAKNENGPSPTGSEAAPRPQNASRTIPIQNSAV